MSTNEIKQDEIIRMAREAGFEVNYYKSLESEEVVSFDPIITYNLERFAALVAAHEREACAKVCETDEFCCKCGDECAVAIRARGEK